MARLSGPAMLSPADSAPRGTPHLDPGAVAPALAGLPADRAGRERELRSAGAQGLRAALADGRAAAEQMLLADRHGRACAERLCTMQDEIIRLIYDLVSKLYRSLTPSDSERMAVVATGGYTGTQLART